MFNINNNNCYQILQGFSKHYHDDHNIYNYVYYALHVKSMSPRDHNAIEKQVFDMVRLRLYSCFIISLSTQMKKSEISFYPLRRAKVLGGDVFDQIE